MAKCCGVGEIRTLKHQVTEITAGSVRRQSKSESSDSVITSRELLVGAVPFILQGAVTFPVLGGKKPYKGRRGLACVVLLGTRQ